MAITTARRTSTFAFAVGSLVTLAGVVCFGAALTDFFALSESSHMRFLGGSAGLVLLGTFFLAGGTIRRVRGE
jgi:hypothetical protein